MTIVCNVRDNVNVMKNSSDETDPSLMFIPDTIIMAVIYQALKHLMDRINLTNDRAKSCWVTGLLNKMGRGGTREKGMGMFPWGVRREIIPEL